MKAVTIVPRHKSGARLLLSMTGSKQATFDRHACQSCRAHGGSRLSCGQKSKACGAHDAARQLPLSLCLALKRHFAAEGTRR